MHKAIEGIFRNGKVELLEPPPHESEGRVLVTFLTPTSQVDLASQGVTPAEAAKFRAGLGVIAEDWERPEMDVYDEDCVPT